MESRLAAALAAVLLLGGCAMRIPAAAPLLPLEPPRPPGLAAVALTAEEFGVLMIDRGCVRVRALRGGALRTVLWLKGTLVDHDAHGYFLRREDGERRYRVGEPIQFGGGGLGDIAPAGTDPEVVQRCGPPYHQGYLSR
ncbi:hypothetical protein DWG18_00520 [Lysobacter sp. TY2-98]|uniref:hypothetical protein n=1 Tax=Lysobacter sp. TY2-98 TaxID=2290922 RepID=UPI000E2076E8|nr:hypothetical protein [Lysobacter sp. TY2-98]AXK70919.1 hypothetical protein DWG18_00520 [Lysobacter sp. TY2-98]